MRSLSYKLILSFLLVNLIAIALAAGFIWLKTSSEFNRLLLEQNQNDYIDIVTEYYAENDTWEGVELVLLNQRLIPPANSPGGQAPPPPPFVLVNQKNEVIVPGKGYTLREIVDLSVLEKGIPIASDEEIVGTVLITGQTPSRTIV